MSSAGGSADSVLFAPHADDESLFAAYTCLREQPLIVVCFDEGRYYDELSPAASVLGCNWRGLAGRGTEDAIRAAMLASQEYGPSRVKHVWAPAYAEDGHEDHNLIAMLAREVYGSRVRSYLTYAPRGERQTNGDEVRPEPWMIARKLRALSFYVSQIELPATRPWFFDLLDLREWVLA